MADTTVFSSFHRSRTQPSQAPRATPAPAAAVAPAPAKPQPRPAPQPDMPVPGLDWADLRAVSLHCDLLGLAHPDVVSLVAQLPGSDPVPLNAAIAGIYRPPGFRPAPWSGFAYDEAMNRRTGLAAGTRLLTARGEVEVENIVPGDAIMALRGPSLLPVTWIGRSVGSASPIRIASGSLGPNTPRRDLCLGPDQPVYLKPVPVAASTLVNGDSIHEAEGGLPDLFHIDVGRPEIIFAEGLALSSGQRGIALAG